MRIERKVAEGACLIGAQRHKRDHRAIVAAGTKGRHRDAHAHAPERLPVGLAQLRVRSDAAADAEVGDAGLLHSLLCLCDLHIDDGSLEGGSKIGQVDGAACIVLALDVGDDGGLEAGEAEGIVARVHHRTWEVNGTGVALCRKAADDRAARISQAQGLGNLVEGLAHGVVDRLAEHLIVSPGLHVHKHRVAAGDKGGHERRLQVGRLEEVCKEMAFEVVHGNDRQAAGSAEALREGDADDKGSDQAWSRRHADRSQI